MRANDTALTTTESQTLSDCERIINGGLIGFAELGRALIKVREGKLYRTTHESFLEYCSDRWGIGKSRCYQLIEASGVVDSMPPEKSTIVDSESKARELAKVPAEKRSQVVEVAAAAGPVTAKSIKEAAAKVAEPSPTQEVAPELESELEPEPELTGVEPLDTVRQGPDALYQGEKAIAFLEQIDANDPNRDLAFDNVVAWIGKARN